MLDKLMHLYGVIRSGNHAIIYWLLHQYDGITEFQGHAYTNRDRAIWIRQYKNHLRGLFNSRPFNWANQPVFWEDVNLWKQHNNKEDYNTTLLLSYEDMWLQEIISNPYSYVIDSTFSAKKRYSIIVLRDMKNWLASCCKSPIAQVNWQDLSIYPDAESFMRVRGLIHMYYDYALEFVGHTNILSNKICINYNKWCESKEYRFHIAESMDLTFTDVGFDEIAFQGGKSSFFDYNTVSHKDIMTPDKWKYYENYLAFHEILDYGSPVLKLSDKIFN